ncbi:MAG: DUF6106 family protein [Muribaculaceae bacterium]|nr:DUF6106 family protein [Roseburia sp.]MCM1430185.1 DUF6106 family protein [Muribaculaceae bacterium]MCM1493115.1 DUF6106 family protein [Muribaculaceae bacterium]
MLEVYVLVPVRKSFLTVFVGILGFVLALMSLVMSCFSMVFAALMVVFGALGYWFTFQTNKEFEYSYFDGEARFAKVINKSRRKRLAVYSMDEVIQIAPSEDRSVYKYQNDNSVKVVDYTSHRKGAPYYVMVLNKEGQITLIRFEPDDKYLEAVMVKYKGKVICRQ